MSIDYLSANTTPAAPFCVAMIVEEMVAPAKEADSLP